ncbi:hypothetical protein AYI69_g9431, partial [Smittium culicis]
PAFHDPKEYWRPQTRLGPPQTQPARGGAKLQNGDIGDNLPHHSQKGLSHVLRSPRCVHAYTSLQELQEVSPLSLERPMLPVSRPTIRAITDPVVYHTPGYGYKYKENDPQGSVNQDQGSSTRGKQVTERWEDDVEISSELYWESPINVDCTAARSPYDSQTSRTKESITVDTEIMYIDSNPDETCHSEPIVLEKQTNVMERALVLSRDARIGNFHGFQRHSLGNSGGIPDVLRIMESKRGEDAHKRQGAAHSIVRPQTQECGRLISVGLFRQHNHSCVREEIRRNNFPRTSQDSRTDLESLSGNEYQTSGHL